MKVSNLACYSLRLTVINSYQKFVLAQSYPVRSVYTKSWLTDLIIFCYTYVNIYLYLLYFNLMHGHLGILIEGLDYLKLPPPAAVAEQRQESEKNGTTRSASGSDVEQSRS
jgi:hypothetical protein